MVDTNASEAGKALIAARWRGQVVSRAVQTIVDRADELTAEQLAELAAVAERKGNDE
jgi:hypothetical protein